MLEQSQRDLHTQLAAITAQLSAIVGQLERQADSTLSGQSWAAFSLSGFDEQLISHGKALIEVGERLRGGALPQWKIDQTKAFENCALGYFHTDKTDTVNSGGSASVPVGDHQEVSEISESPPRKITKLIRCIPTKADQPAKIPPDPGAVSAGLQL